MANQKVSILQGTDGTLYDIDDQTKLEKTTYEWNKEITFGSTGKLFIGSFPMYDSNLTITISATTGITYHGTLVLATQNAKNTQVGVYTATVYNDAADTIAPNIYIERLDNSNIYNIYFNPQPWSKNLIHIQAVGLNVNPSYGPIAPDDIANICTSISEIPATATIKPKNALVENFLGSSDNITVKDGDVLALNNKELSTTYINEATTTVTVGGLNQGSNVNGWSLKQILDKLLYKYVAPVVSKVAYTATQTNDYICGSVTFSKAVATVSANSVKPGITSSTFTWNGQTYTGNNAGTTINAFGTKDITFTMNYTFTGTADTTSIAAKSGKATVNLSNAGENGEALTISKSQNSTAYYFDRSEYYWGGAASATGTVFNKDNTSNNTQRTKLGSGTGTALTAVLNNQVFTLVTPKKWGTTLKVYDGASNPVTGVFKNAGEVTITNRNNYNETYIVWKGAAATGTIKYFFQIS